MAADELADRSSAERAHREAEQAGSAETSREAHYLEQSRLEAESAAATKYEDALD
jgi:hypothetical protein